MYGIDSGGRIRPSINSPPLLHFRYGWLITPGVDHVCWFDQLYFDNGDDLGDTGNKLSTAKLSTSATENNFNTTGGTGAVNERPLSLTNFKQHTAPTSVRQTYAIQSAATGDIDISGEQQVAYMAWLWAKLGAGDLETVAMVVNGVEVDRTAVMFQAGTNAILLKEPVTTATYPSDAATVGMVSNNETADTFIYECGVVAAYEGPPNPDILLERQLVNNETLATITDDLRAAPPDSYEVCCNFPEFDGTVQIVVHSLDQDGGSVQFQGTLNSNGRMRISPGVEVYLDVTVTGVTNLQIWRRLNVD